MAALYVFIIITCFIQLVFYLAVYTKFLKLDTRLPKIHIEDCKPVSVVICARNEAENIKKYLPIVLEQQYPRYEVIVIDDGSEDDSGKVLAEMENRYPGLLSFRIEPIEKSHGGKKQAISHGVSLAKYDWIVVTDADCCPAGNRWLLHMTAGLAGHADIVLGVSPYFPGQHRPAPLYFRTETLFVALQYINYALAGLPFMGVGRNMAYKRHVFEKHDLARHWDLLSGDDDLFVNDVADNSIIEICANLDGFTYSEPPPSVTAWFRQKLRHYTTGYRYNLLQKIWLGYYWLSSLVLYALVPLSILSIFRRLPFSDSFASLLLVTLAVRWSVIFLSLRKLGERKVSLGVPIFDLVYILSVWILSPLARLGINRWK